jgi:hypothetical protein
MLLSIAPIRSTLQPCEAPASESAVHDQGNNSFLTLPGTVLPRHPSQLTRERSMGKRAITGLNRSRRRLTATCRRWKTLGRAPRQSTTELMWGVMREAERYRRVVTDCSTPTAALSDRITPENQDPGACKVRGATSWQRLRPTQSRPPRGFDPPDPPLAQPPTSGAQRRTRIDSRITSNEGPHHPVTKVNLPASNEIRAPPPAHCSDVTPFEPYLVHGRVTFDSSGPSWPAREIQPSRYQRLP